jgi:hypothetical protein
LQPVGSGEFRLGFRPGSASIAGNIGADYEKTHSEIPEHCYPGGNAIHPVPRM